MSVRVFEHGRGASVPCEIGTMKATGRSEIGQLLVELEFLVKLQDGLVANERCMVYISAKASKRVQLYRQWLSCSLAFQLLSDSYSDENYDPECPRVEVRMGSPLRREMLQYNQAHYEKCALVCDLESVRVQMYLFDILKPFRALLQFQPPYPCGKMFKGWMVYPLCCETCTDGLVYMYTGWGWGESLFKPDVLESEMFAFHLLIRGVISTPCMYDERVIEGLQKRVCPLIDIKNVLLQ